MKKLKEIDIIDSIKLIAQNADNTEFITKTINDIYQLGYNHGYSDMEEIADKVLNSIKI